MTVARRISEVLAGVPKAIENPITLIKSSFGNPDQVGILLASKT
jgi:hypothetical protein